MSSLMKGTGTDVDPPMVSAELESMVGGKDQPEKKEQSGSSLKDLAILISICALGIVVIILAVTSGNSGSSSGTISSAESEKSNVPNNKSPVTETIFSLGTNKCADKKLKFENHDCIHVKGPQAGANVTEGYVGGMDVDFVPNTKKYWQSAMCPVNVHWHLGSEHYSLGEYDESGDGPHGTAPAPERRRLAGEVRGGFRCHHYDKSDARFTTKYEWKHCKNMEVGETYEVHWPHSAAGACGTVDQYQTPFYDGVFCNLPMEGFLGLAPQDIASAVGVQAQIYTVVNDEAYFYPDLIRGWIVDGEYGDDIHIYTGSTTGTSRDNDKCSSYTPITWQVDRKCHLISASSFDKLCYDMKLQRDDMSDDLHAHGSRLLVADEYVANNQVNGYGRKLQEYIMNNQLYEGESKNLREHSHDHDHSHHHDHDHAHDEWF